jgi:hypothetical protein
LGRAIVPDRLYANWSTGYAHLLTWTTDPAVLKAAIELAIQKAQPSKIDNTLVKLSRNRP